MKKISVVGCGFIGSHLAEEISKLLHSQTLTQYLLRFIDFDTWEDRNAANQNVNLELASVEEKKADTCAKYASGYHIPSESIVERLTHHNGAELLKDSALVIDCVDNIPTRQAMWILAKSGATAPCMHIGISRKGEGIINWSSPEFDTFPFPPQAVVGRDLKEQDVKELPCEMYKYRIMGMYLFQAAAKAIAFYLGVDPWDYLGIGSKSEPGTMTCWTTGEHGIIIRDEEMYLNKDATYFPVATQNEVIA